MFAQPARAQDVNVVFQGNYTVTTGTLKLTLSLSALQAGNVYTTTTKPVGGNLTTYGDPYIYGVFMVDGSTTARVVTQSRHDDDTGEIAHLREDLMNPGENKAQFWFKCEVASCYMTITVYEREDGSYDDHTFYRDGEEPFVLDGQFSLYKDLYHPTEKNGDYGLQVDYEADRYIYLYRNGEFDTGGMNALSMWVRSSGSVEEEDLTLALTTGSNHQIITDWLPLSNYIDMPASHTWYRAIIPLSDLNPGNYSVRGLAVKSDVSGFVYFDDVEFVSETVPLLWPLEGGFPGGTITSPFGDDWVSSCGGLVKKHAGLDVDADIGDDVLSAMSGTVKHVYTSDPTWGDAVVVEDESGDFTVVYWHIDAWVSENDSVSRGDMIGTVADISAGSHLHFGYRQGSYHSRFSLLGALPQTSCGDPLDPAFPENFEDPETLDFVSW